mgnify:FL=1
MTNQISGIEVFRRTNTAKLITEQALPLELPEGIVIQRTPEIKPRWCPLRETTQCLERDCSGCENLLEAKGITDNMRDYWVHLSNLA